LVAFRLLHLSDVLSCAGIFFVVRDLHCCSNDVCEGFLDALWHQLCPSTDINVSILSHYKITQHCTVLSYLVLYVHFASIGTLSRESRDYCQVGPLRYHLFPLPLVIIIVLYLAASEDQDQFLTLASSFLNNRAKGCYTSSWSDHNQRSVFRERHCAFF